MVTLQIISDAHLEVNNCFPEFEVKGDYLALCGDIGTPGLQLYQKFLEYVSERYQHVFVIAGNHEYYHAHHTMEEIDHMLYEVTQRYNNVHYLQNEAIEINGITFVGSTLWSNVSGTEALVEAGVNDYKRIKRKVFDYDWNRGITLPTYKRLHIKPSDTLALHRKAVDFLEQEILKHDKVVILTHHLPTFKNIDPQYVNALINTAYATNLEYMIRAPLLLWAHGHSHHFMDTQINGVRVVCNPVGYRGQKTGYDPGFIIDL
jgi:predicted phosphodiesterase